MAQRLPTLFVSHGAPTVAVEDIPAARAWAALGRDLPQPRAILSVSAHWETSIPAVSNAERPETLYDFYGFPDPLYDLTYPAPGAPDLAQRAAGLLDGAGFPCAVLPHGLDHGSWVPLMRLYPAADIPVCQLSIQTERGGAWHLALGAALAPLREDGVLVLASGGAVHNLRYFRPASDQVPDWARKFSDWLAEAAVAGDGDRIAAYRKEEPELGPMAHPRDEHLLPLLVALGAAGPGARGQAVYRGFADGGIAMDAFRFD